MEDGKYKPEDINQYVSLFWSATSISRGEFNMVCKHEYGSRIVVVELCSKVFLSGGPALLPVFSH